MSGWRRVVQEEKSKRETEKFLRLKEEEEMNKKLAQKHYEKKLVRSVWKCLRETVLKAKEQRMIQEEHNRIQQQINEFLERMKATTEESNITEVSLNEEERQPELNTIEECSKESDILRNRIETPVAVECGIQASPHETPAKEVTEQENKELVNKDSKQKMKKQSKLVAEMEEREKKRKGKREQLKRIYEEKQKVKEQQRLEEERKKSEEEKKRRIEEREKKKQEKLIKKKQEEAKAKFQAKISFATDHSSNRLKRLTFKSFKLNIDNRVTETSRANGQYRKTLKKVICILISREL